MSQDSSHTGLGTRALRWRFGLAVLDGRSLELTVAGSLVRLEPKPLELLLHLLRHPGEVVTKEELHESLWAGRFLSESVLTKTMARLRQALGDEEQLLIKTVHGYGYRLVVPVVAEASADTVEPASGFSPGEAIPHRPGWLMESSLGSGGQGEVWLGRHAKTGERRVFKFSHDAAGLTGLKRELTLYRVIQQATPGGRRDVVRLHDFNLETPPFFLEAEYVQGGNLPQWFEAQGGLAALPLQRRVALAAEVAESLAAAHGAGVLHKDLKPSNILIALDEQGAPYVKLADFGSGRMMDLARLEQLEITRLGFTQTIAVGPEGASGTPLYLAPELLGGLQPSARSDIYALGVMLFQLVVGDFRRPLAPGWEAEVPDALLREDIAEAAAGNPLRRLGEAATLAQRLRQLPERRREREQHLSLQAERARTEAEAQTLRQQLHSARSRRRWLRALAVVLAGGLGLSSWGFWQARQAQQATQVAAREAESVARFVTEDFLQSADPIGAARPQLTVTQLLDEASARLKERLRDQPQAEAKILYALARAYQGMGDWASARQRLAEAVEQSASAFGPDHPNTLRARLDLAYAQLLNDDYAQAEATYQALAAVQRDRPEDDPLWLDTRDALAHQDFVRGNFAGAVAQYEALLRDYQRLGLIDRLNELRSYLPEVYTEVGRYDEAEAMTRSALAASERKYGKDHPRQYWIALTLGEVLMESQHWKAADAVFIHCYEGLRRHLGEMHPYTLTALHYHGALLLRSGNPEAAMPHLVQAFTARQSVHGAEHAYTLFSAHRLGQAYAATGEFTQAMQLLRTALDAATRRQGAEHPNTLELRLSLAEAEHLFGNHQAARTIMVELLPLARSLLPPQGPRIGRFEKLAAALEEKAQTAGKS